MTTETPRQELLEFPCEFPIKIMGARVDDFAQQILSVVQQTVPDYDGSNMEMRPSSKGTYLSLTCTITATSRAQLDQVYLSLTSHPLVKVVL